MSAPGSGAIDKNSLHHRNQPVNSLTILSRMFTLYRQVQKQERYIQSHLPKLLADVVPDHHQTFSPPHIKRITKYWQLALNVICESLYNLTGKKLHADEYKRIILLSVFGPLFDDLFDDQLLTNEQIASLVSNPEKYVAVNKTDLLVVKLYLELLRLTPRPQQFIGHLQDVAHWQNESLKQLNENITEEELYKITYNKSYYAVLLYCAVLDHYPNQKILEMLYPMAGLMQLTNDAFDVFKDIMNGVYTLPNLYLNLEQLQQQFMAETAKINQIISQLPYPVKARQAYAITIHSLPAMGWLALEQLKQATGGISTFKALSSLSRKTLVCDMDSLSQKIKWLQHIRRFTNYYG
ncbi:class 1 isoprenoid biosynthesis enzyme [Niastella caeni]|uniref:Class 1 isoprenoid biosynthesis enzyme n=1 Tax=Niastella caeni TaxID=2569763 RepID=A0A4S8HNH6_9BACT|nr:class 1 isoprenoid biosynthesis enzyme [Niastella caeni]THU36930.1 class 1 isoprenoid biosynthesis enzyme [Niastella caeni]